MIVTKENVAAHAFARHFLRLELPDSINCLVGRLVGYVEMKKGPANRTVLDIPPAFRNDVLRSKQVSGGGFHQECQQPYGPVASWMEDTDVALNDEGQQYGNLDEASAIARAPRKCLVIWCGDHKQTPGGLRKTDEAKAFRRKLLRRPIALRGDTEHFQPNMLGKIVLRYLEGMDEPLINGIQAILRETMGGTCLASAEGIATLQTLCQEVGCPYHDELCFTTRCIALVVLWMALHQEKFPLLATSLQAAAGVCGRQRWALILPSSARVSLVTYTAVIAVRYPELDNVQNDLVCFGNYLLGEQATSGGFLPIFWDAPSAYMHAATDIGSAVDWLRRMGHPVGRCGSVKERYILCRHDCPLCSLGANKGRVSQWRKEQAYEGAAAKGGSRPVGGSLCSGNSSSDKSPEDVYHHGPLRHARAAWSCHGNRVSQIWCRRLWCAC